MLSEFFDGFVSFLSKKPHSPKYWRRLVGASGRQSQTRREAKKLVFGFKIIYQ